MNPNFETGSPLNPKPETVRQVSSGNKCFYFQNLHENYHTNPSGRDLCVVIFLAKLSKGRYLIPNFLTTDREIVLQVMIDIGEDGKAERTSSSVSYGLALALLALKHTVWFYQLWLTRFGFSSVGHCLVLALSHTVWF